jgi:dihydropteroate synthase-like protein
MKILLATGRLAEEQVRGASAGADVLVLDVDIASFITPEMLKEKAPTGYDLILIPGAITSDFSAVERELGTKVRLGPKHAVDLGYVLSHIEEIELSTSIPACVLLADTMRDGAHKMLEELESEATSSLKIKGVKIGGNSRMKVLAEIVDATRLSDADLERKIAAYEKQGADMIDLGIPLDSNPKEVAGAVERAIGVTELPVSIDTTLPDLIVAGVESGADLILSLDGANIPLVGKTVSEAGIPAVVIPGPDSSLALNVAAARELGIDVIADPVLKPPLQGLTASILDYVEFQDAHPEIPLFLGIGNVTELLDADSPGINGLLAAIGAEIGAAILFTPEYSDKARGSIHELKVASRMMHLAKKRKSPPKDLGIDLLILKEKRARPNEAFPKDYELAESDHKWTMDPVGSFRIGVVDGKILASHEKINVIGTNAAEILNTLIDFDLVTRLDHAGYLGRELAKAEIAIRLGRSYSQDDPF